jgi:hypothetical protein
MKLSTIAQFTKALKAEDQDAYRIARTEILAQLKTMVGSKEEMAAHYECVRQGDAKMFRAMQKQGKVTKGVKFRH